MSLDMYAEEILDNYRNPKNFGKMENPDVVYKELNPLCGDEYEFQLKLEGEIVKDVKFRGDGCAISMASSSMLSEFVKGKSVSELERLTPDDVFKLLKISVSPARMKCALLSLSVLMGCIKKRSDV